MRPRRILGLVAILALSASACSSLRTTSSPVGDRTLTATFNDVQHLVVGHTVRIGDVPVGTVTGVKLDGFDAVVDISISDNHDIPSGTTASISATTLLGENFVRLNLPENDPGTVLEDGDELETTLPDASFEEMTVKVLALLRGIQGGDIATVIDESHAALVGRGPELNELIGTVEAVSDGLVTQTEDLVAVIDSLAAFGDGLVDNTDLLGTSIEATAEATGQLATQRDRIVNTVEQIVEVAGALDDGVLVPHRAQLDQILDRLNPIAGTLVEELDQLVSIVEGALALGQKAPNVVGPDSAARGYVIVKSVVLPGGSIVEIPCVSCVLGVSSNLAVPAGPLSSAETVESILFGAMDGAGQP